MLPDDYTPPDPSAPLVWDYATETYRAYTVTHLYSQGASNKYTVTVEGMKPATVTRKYDSIKCSSTRCEQPYHCNHVRALSHSRETA